jgi:hypothetical protein
MQRPGLADDGACRWLRLLHTNLCRVLCEVGPDADSFRLIQYEFQRAGRRPDRTNVAIKSCCDYAGVVSLPRQSCKLALLRV